MKKKKNLNCFKLPCRNFECWFNFFSWRVWLAAFAFGAIAQFVHSLLTLASVGYYTDPAYFGVWSKLMMPHDGGFSSNFIYYSLTVNVFLGVVFAGLYKWLHACFCGQGWQRGLCFGWLLFLVKSLPFSITCYLLFALPAGLVILWLVENFVIDLTGGIVLALIIGKYEEVREDGYKEGG